MEKPIVSSSGIYPFRGELMVPYASTLGRDFLVRLEIDNTVLSVESQPLTLEYFLDTDRKSEYTPDFFVTYKSSAFNLKQPSELIEVKSRDLQMKDNAQLNNQKAICMNDKYQRQTLVIASFHKDVVNLPKEVNLDGSKRIYVQQRNIFAIERAFWEAKVAAPEVYAVIHWKLCPESLLKAFQDRDEIEKSGKLPVGVDVQVYSITHDGNRGNDKLIAQLAYQEYLSGNILHAPILPKKKSLLQLLRIKAV